MDARVQLGLAAASTGARLAEQNIYRCPKCSNGNLHLIGVGMQQERRLTMQLSDGWHVINDAPYIGPGSAMFHIFTGECGHTTAEIFQFYKGVTYHDRIHLVDGFFPSLTLWRA